MKFRALLALACWTVPGWSQTPPSPAQPEILAKEAPLTFSSRVNLVSVPVVVRDRDGRAIGTLRQEDFQLFDKGKLQLITKFSVEKADAVAAAATALEPPAPARPVSTTPVLPERYVAYLIDDIHLQRGDLLQTRLAVNRHLDESIDLSTRAAIFTTSGLMLADFTADREKLHQAVSRVQPWTSGPDPQQDCPPVTYYLADLLVNKLLYLDGVLFSDAQLVQMIASGKADAALSSVYAEAMACMACGGDSACQTQAIIAVRVAARQALTYGDRETASALGALKDVARKLSAIPGSRNLVLVSPGFLLTRDHQSEEYDVLDRAIRANVTVNTIDMRGLFTTIPGGDASQSRSYSSSAAASYDATAATQADDILAELASGTGGTFFHNDNRLKEGLNQLAARPEYLYVLGYSPENLKFDGTYHGLKVTLRNSANLTLQARRGYWAPRHAADPAEAAREEIQETVFSRDEILDLPVDLQTEFFKPTDEKAELTVSVRLKPESLVFRKAGDRNHDTLTVVAGLFDANGNYIAGIQKVVELRLRDQTLAAVANSGIVVKEDFHVAPGRYVVRLVVRDAEGQTMAARNGGVEIP
ncbi:MAG: VWA domain-containing protein [Acidobacteriia bacterium]|nr:VWA domain-containing protein [Terriglobia bacterium]